LFQLGQEVTNTVSPPLFTEPAKVAEVLAYLRRSYLQLLAKLLGVSHLYAFRQQLVKDTYVLRQPLNYDFRDFGPAIDVVW
jgi:hypothetical protein